MNQPENPSSPKAPEHPEVVSLQNVCIIDHVCTVSAESLQSLIHDELGGSHRVSIQEIHSILATLGDFITKSGGAASNTLRSLAGFGVRTRLIGARGHDEWGPFFASSLKRCNVDVSRLISKPGQTGRCVILSCNGERTMRTCMDDAARLSIDDLDVKDFSGCRFFFLSGYCLYSEGLSERAVQLALEAGCEIVMDLGSFEIIRTFKQQLTNLLENTPISLIFCNEDEAIEISGGPGTGTADKGLEYLSSICTRAAIVTLGERGCLVKEHGSDDKIIAQPACGGIKVVDTTGAGDSFSAGFLFGVLRGNSYRRAAEIGCLAGGAVVQTLGSEMHPGTWQWLHQKMHGDLAAEAVRSSAAAVQQELLACYALIENKGRGIVYYGSARLKEDSPFWNQAVNIGKKLSTLLNCTTWSGGGPGMMQAATMGAVAANGVVAGIRIAREAGTTVRSASYLPSDAQVVCRFLSSRKVALTDCGVRMKEEDRTAFIFLPGGLGTLDEFFELATLVQLKKLGTKYPVPIVLCNFGGCFDGLLEFLSSSVLLGTVGMTELKELLVARDEDAVVNALSYFYGLDSNAIGDENDGGYRDDGSLLRASSWIDFHSRKTDTNRD